MKISAWSSGLGASPDANPSLRFPGLRPGVLQSSIVATTRVANHQKMTNPFVEQQPLIAGNAKLRIPQRELFKRLQQFAEAPANSCAREVGAVLPVGCGKSGCIVLAPFAFGSRRTLVVAPNLTIAAQLVADFDPANADAFYLKTGVLTSGPYPEPVEIRGTTTNRSDLNEADVVITNIQQLQGTANRWLDQLPADYFDLILFDEGHHNVASSWDTLRNKFPDARIVNFSATPLRADGQLMAGEIVYSYPVARAIKEGYVKRLKAMVLNPRSLRYVRNEDGVEIDVNLEEVRRLGEEDADFRRSIVTSQETLNTIADASIRELQRLRRESGDNNLKIIASALNYAHCAQIVAAYQSRGLRADYVHSREDAAANKRVLKKLTDDELDVIVQVRKLGEGFDHKRLAVAAVFSVFGSLSPFIQFVGRVMRVVEQDAPDELINRGVVVFHAGANVARHWTDFQQYSEADQAYFDQLLPLEGLDFTDADELTADPDLNRTRNPNEVEVRGQVGVQVQEIPLIDAPEDVAALERLVSKYGATAVTQRITELAPVPTTKVRERQAKRRELDMRVQTEAAAILRSRGINLQGSELDRKYLGRTNSVVMIAALNAAVNEKVGQTSGKRHELSRVELDQIEAAWHEVVGAATNKVFDV